ncbi:hypothetical protein DOM21_10995 [Bacteriovorax stolpii]|uniref:Uncharacterized protein n=1 Tax=Bacteriovorax stolpii TaxID=960 RepID=A0A2K9NRA0_BACTC|nr:hypothetical protein [Bacteriovorax stolpii]AUN98056.1 hypothetical protein C0V70_08030 [Bacteriovorax stolpii]QDK41964.1 hypothetical protein DOM21_10995 [Bacteriovorax stolpii]TDP51970.1 hypothetical protein C8D79_2616 [Bacteriovorax stolpii]BDT28148.1 hypothetical protein BHI3_16140 [Bacteriovorax sp. HI3]
MLKGILALFLCLQVHSALAIESLDGFLVSAYDDRFRVISPEKFKNSMEVIIENKTLVRLIGKLTINKQTNASMVSIDPEKYQRAVVKLKKGDILHFVPLSPAFQEVELIVGNKTYEIPPKK